MLQRINKLDNWVVRAGKTDNAATDFWLHMGFVFDGQKTDVIVEWWAVTNSEGVEINLNKLLHDDVQFLAQAMLEEFSYVRASKYYELEEEYYSSKTDKRIYDDEFGRG